MHDGPSKCLDAVERGVDVGDLEVRERERVSGTRTAAVHPDG
jgi:hypothetical protein